MSKRVILIGAIGLTLIAVLFVGCVSRVETPTAVIPTLPLATGVPAATATSRTASPGTRVPTPARISQPTPINTTALFQVAGDLLKSYQPPETDVTPLYDALAQGVILFLTATANPDVSLEGQPAIDRLREALATPPNLPANAKPQIAVIHVGDDQGGSRDLILILLEHVMGLPVIGVQRFGPDYQSLPVSTFGAVTNFDERYFFPIKLETYDLNDNDLKEIVYVYEFPGGSGSTRRLYVQRWNQETEQVHTLFHATLVSWIGESDYEFDAASTPPTIKLTYAWFGPFDQKMVVHQIGTQIWKYDAAQDKFVKQSEAVEPARTPRQQLNLAEVLFRNGDLNGAVAAYERAYSDPSLAPEEFNSQADPASFAKFRQAQALALLGRESDARKLLSEVQKSGDVLGSLATAFTNSYSGKEGALRAWIAIANQGTLHSAIYNGTAGNLDFPFEAREIYFEGAVVSSYLNTHPGAAADSAEVRQALTDLAFNLKGWLAADLDGDGSDEYLFVTEGGKPARFQAQVLWLVYKRGEAWRARSIHISEQIGLSSEAFPLSAGKGSAVKLELPPSSTPDELALTWDGTHLISLDTDTLERAANGEFWPTVGSGVLEDDF